MAFLTGIHSKKLSLRRAFSVALLGIALVGTQIFGVAHRIEHVPASSKHDGHAHQSAHHDGGQHEDQGGSSSSHDCAAYDAATLGDGPPVQIATQVSKLPKQFLIASIDSSVANTSPHLPFRSRAPPRA